MSSDPRPASDRATLLGALDRELRRVSGHSVLFSHAVAERLGMHPTDLECLGFLLDEGPVPASRLAEVTGLSTGAVTRMIDRLERAGYVRRAGDPRDRRRVIVQPIAERARAVAPLFAGMERAMAELYARYTDEQLALILDFASGAASAAKEQAASLQAAGPGVRRTPAAPPMAGEGKRGTVSTRSARTRQSGAR